MAWAVAVIFAMDFCALLEGGYRENEGDFSRPAASAASVSADGVCGSAGGRWRCWLLFSVGPPPFGHWSLAESRSRCANG